MGIVFAIFMIFFGLAYVYSAAIGTNNHSDESFYLLSTGFMCLAIASAFLFLSVKLYHHRYNS
jgi:cell division protein FtsW (lipid II flippase)